MNKFIQDSFARGFNSQLIIVNQKSPMHKKRNRNSIEIKLRNFLPFATMISPCAEMEK